MTYVKTPGSLSAFRTSAKPEGLCRIMRMNTMTPPEFRNAAIRKVALGILGCLLMAGILVAIAFAGYTPGNPFMLIPAAIPFVYFCIGSIELITGRPYRQLAEAWMTLRGWQRGVLGTLIVLVGGLVIVVVMVAAVVMLT